MMCVKSSAGLCMNDSVYCILYIDDCEVWCMVVYECVCSVYSLLSQ